MRPRDGPPRPRLARARAGAHPARAHGTLSGEDEIGEHHAPRRRRAQDRAERARRRGRLPARRGARRARDDHAALDRGRARPRTALVGRHLRRTRSTCSWSAAATTAPFLPGFEARAERARATRSSPGIDHVVGNVELGHMEEWVGYYERVFGMTELIHFSDEAISTEYSALMSKVVTDGSGRLKFPINEPAEGKRKSQIEEYLDFYRGAGRAARGHLHARHRRARVGELRARGVEFLAIPGHTTTRCPSRIGEIEQDLADLRRLGILVDRDDEGYLLQIFTKPLGDRPTLFFEIIERHGVARLRRGELQGPVRGDRARAGPEGQPMRYERLGEIPRKRHVQVRRNGAGSPLLTEEVMGYEGFSGNETILYHLHSPCRLDAVGGFQLDRARGVGARRPRAPAGRHRPGGARRRPAQRPAPADVERRHRGLALQADRAARRLLPQRRGRRGHLRPPRRRRAAHRVRAACRSARRTTS